MARPLSSYCLHGVTIGRSAGYGFGPDGRGDARGETTAMFYRSSIAAAAVLGVLCVASGDARAWDDSKYPDLSGQWRAIGGPGRFDISKPAGRGQQAPLTPEYQAIFEANAKEQAAGGQGTTKTYRCFSPGMPRVTNGYGRYDVLEVETRGLRGPRSFDASGLPLHADNQTVVKERIYIDKNDPNIAHDEVTVIDNALTRPWTVTKNYRRSPDPYPAWTEENCPKSTNHVTIPDETSIPIPHAF